MSTFFHTSIFPVYACEFIYIYIDTPCLKIPFSARVVTVYNVDLPTYMYSVS